MKGNALLKRYRLTIETQTPLHIGTGTTLLNNFDFMVVDGETYRLNLDAVLDYIAPADAGALDRRTLDQLMRTPPAQLLKPQDLRDNPRLWLYKMRGTPQATGPDAGQIRELIKDVHGRLYIPGSSLKGAIRTALSRALASVIYDERMPPIQRKKLRRDKWNPKLADDFVDTELFRPHKDQATYDLLRALRVADSAPVEASPMLANVRVFRGAKSQSPIEVEAVPGGMVFQADISLDEYILDACFKAMGFWEGKFGSARRTALTKMVKVCRVIGKEYLIAEKQFYQDVDFSSIIAVLDALSSKYNEKEREGEPSFLLQLGWAGGWESKTLGKKILARDEREFLKLREDFDLGKPPRAHSWSPSRDTPFPASRRLVVDKDDNPIAPMGWVLVTMTEQPLSRWERGWGEGTAHQEEP